MTSGRRPASTSITSPRSTASPTPSFASTCMHRSRRLPGRRRSSASSPSGRTRRWARTRSASAPSGPGLTRSSTGSRMTASSFRRSTTGGVERRSSSRSGCARCRARRAVRRRCCPARSISCRRPLQRSFRRWAIDPGSRSRPATDTRSCSWASIRPIAISPISRCARRSTWRSTATPSPSNCCRGLAVPTGQIVAKVSFGYDANRDPTKFDPERAKQLIKEAGYQGEPIPMQYPNDYIASADAVRHGHRRLSPQRRRQRQAGGHGVQHLLCDVVGPKASRYPPVRVRPELPRCRLADLQHLREQGKARLHVPTMSTSSPKPEVGGRSDRSGHS